MTTVLEFQTRWFCQICKEATPHTEDIDVERNGKKGKVSTCIRCGKETFTAYKARAGRPRTPLYDRVAKMVPSTRFLMLCNGCGLVWLSRFAQQPKGCWKCKSWRIELLATVKMPKRNHHKLLLQKLQQLIEQGNSGSRASAIRATVHRLIERRGRMLGIR